MNSPENPSEGYGPSGPKSITRTRRPLPDEEEEFTPRYVDAPRFRAASAAGSRNLKLGVFLSLVALTLGVLGVIVTGPRALLPLLICLGTFLILWLLTRLRLFRQRNGVFVALMVVCMLGATIPFIERGYSALERMFRREPPSALAGTAPAIPGAEFAPEPNPSSDAAGLPSLVETLQLPQESLSEGKYVRVVADSKVTIGRNEYRVQPGDVFPLIEARSDEVVFSAKGFRLSLPAGNVEIVDADQMRVADAAPSTNTQSLPASVSRTSDKEAPADITDRAQVEAVRRYPALGVEGSPENRLFVQTVKRFKAERPEFFEEPEWPVFLAEGLAQENGWVRVSRRPARPDASPPPAAPASPAPPPPAPGEGLPEP
ncbi:MAG: hypothetical protein M3463_09385 [Verrucomicrobiota bacterium]|nr:hypothetical protein [Verrucomicrobiota bacterium]